MFNANTNNNSKEKKLIKPDIYFQKVSTHKAHSLGKNDLTFQQHETNKL
jgi:hypothetical protein